MPRDGLCHAIYNEWDGWAPGFRLIASTTAPWRSRRAVRAHTKCCAPSTRLAGIGCLSRPEPDGPPSQKQPAGENSLRPVVPPSDLTPAAGLRRRLAHRSGDVVEGALVVGVCRERVVIPPHEEATGTRAKSEPERLDLRRGHPAVRGVQDPCRQSRRNPTCRPCPGFRRSTRSC